jgi:hypothetical protein
VILVLACVVLSSASLIWFLIRFADRHERERERADLSEKIRRCINGPLLCSKCRGRK